ncbi:right-handed parallel beta-helix repeat-containing protein [Pontibacter saemangeumensis]
MMLIMVLEACSALAVTYYISPHGDDAGNTGTSRTQPWATIGKVNATVFNPGDSVLFEGGSTFEGSLYFGSAVRGTAANPVVISSYGTGKATIRSGSQAGIHVYNSAGFKLENLVFQGAGRTDNSSSGIDFYMDQPGNARLDYIAINNVEVSGYRLSGIAIRSWSGASGFDNVSITHSRVHDNGDSGISSYAEATLGHRNVYVGHNKVYNNSGLPEKTELHSGNGIVLGGVDGAVIEYCEAYNNGWLNAWTTGGPVGIWGYHCNNLVIQYNESHHNRTGTTKDGGGFDIDGGCTNSIMQYNYSHDNEGAGFLVAQYAYAPPMKGIVVRYNISENDGRKNGYGAIHLWSSGANGGIQDLEIYNNTVYLSPAGSGEPKAIYVQEGGATAANIRNNIFQTTGGLEVVNVQQLPGLRFEGNSYWSGEGSLHFNWAGTTYTSLADWRAASGQEQLGDSSLGYSIAPGLQDPGKGGTLGDPYKRHTLTGYELKEDSGLAGKGLNLATSFQLSVGSFDFFGNSLEDRLIFSVGAHQPEPSTLPVTFGAFRAYRKEGVVVLDWETASEQNNLGFEVEVSDDGRDFRPIGFVASKSTNSQSRQFYSFTDVKSAVTGFRYYRIRQVDLDGTFSFSLIRAIQGLEAPAGPAVSPNPFSDAFVLEVHALQEEEVELTVQDMLGRVVIRKVETLQKGQNQLRLFYGEEQAKGLFIVSAVYGGNTHQLKVLKH